MLSTLIVRGRVSKQVLPRKQPEKTSCRTVRATLTITRNKQSYSSNSRLGSPKNLILIDIFVSNH